MDTKQPMRIALDVNPVLLNGRTGVGFCTAGQSRELVRRYPEDQFLLQCFSRAGEVRTKELLSDYGSENCESEICAILSDKKYRMLCTFFPLPYRWLFHGKAEVSHFFNFFVPPFVSGKTVVTVHDMAYRRYPETVKWQKRWLLNLQLQASMKAADRIVVGTQFGKEEVMQYFPIPAEKIRVVPIGVDVSRYHRVSDSDRIMEVSRKYGIPECYFLYLGTLEPRKNLVRLVQAYGLFRKLAQDGGIGEIPALVLAGKKGWIYDEIFHQVRASGLKGHVIFPGYIADEDAPVLMSSALAFVFPSLYEGFGMPPLEAMACGTPVLTSNAASLPEVAGDAALLVDPLDVESIARGLVRLMEDEALRTQLVVRGYQRVQYYSWERAADELHAIYRELVDEHHAARRRREDQA